MAGGLLKGAWFVDLRTGKCAWSPIVREILGLAPDTPARPWPECAQVFSTALQGQLAEFWAEASQGKPFVGTGVTATGRAFEFSAEPIFEEGELAQVIGTITAAAEMSRLLNDSTAFRSIADFAPSGIFLADAEGQALFANRECLRILGADPDEALGRGWMQFLPEEDVGRVMAQWEAATAKGETYYSEHHFVRRDGKRFPVRTKASQIITESGLQGYVGIIEDITDETQTHLDLLASEGLFRTLADTVPAHVWVLGKSLQPHYWNKTLLDYTGLSDEQVRSRGTMTVVHPEDLSASLDVLRRARRDKKDFELRQRLRGADGKYRWFLVRGVCVLTEEGDIDRLVGISTDIEDAIEMSEERKRLFSILEATVDLVSIATPDGEIRYLNPAGRAMLGYGADESIAGMHVKDTRPLWAAELLSNVAVPYAAETGCWIGETAFLSRDGREIPTSQAVLVHKNHLGKIDYFSTIARDISEQKRIEAELSLARDQAMAATRAKSLFLANMSHEIRTPLNGIIGLASLLARKLEDQGDQELASGLQASSESLTRIINDILDFSKMEAGRMSLEQNPVELSHLVSDVLALFGAHAQERGIGFDVELPPDPCWVLSDSLRLRQVLSNLVSNAIKFTNHGRVTLSLDVETTGNRVHAMFRVRDTGVGMSPETQAVIFETFGQADPSIARKHGGTGLGLSICKGLVELFGGTIECESELGKGTTFTVELDFDQARPLVAEVPPDVTGTAGKRVLVAEDNDVNQLVAVQVLADLGCQVVVVDNGIAAIKAALSSAFDLILMDLHMPLCGGLEATKAIRHQEVGRRTPIVALTANADAGGKEQCLEAGMDDAIQKPFTFVELQQAVRTYAAKS
jgi:PAS domain S-box-containing protein